VPLTYCGIALPLETDEVRGYLDQFHTLDNLVEQSLDGIPGVGLEDALPNTGQKRWGRKVSVGVLHFPRSASACATFHAVVNSTRLNLIRAVVDSSGPYQPLVLSDGVNDPVTVTMRPLPPRPLFQIADAEQLYLLSLVDIRYDLNHNRSGSVTSTPASWSDLFDTLETQLGITLSTEAVDSDYGVPSDRWVQYRKPLTAILDAAAETVGQRVVFGLDGTAETVGWEAALSASDTQYDLYRKCGGGAIQQEDIRRHVPESVTTVFPTFSGTPFSVTDPLAGLSITGYGDATGVADCEQTLLADLTYDGTNASECADYSAAAAEDWYGWQLCDLDVTLAGIVPWVPTGAEDCIEWTYSITDPGPRLLTRIQRGPWGGFPTGSVTADPAAYVPTPSDSECVVWYTGYLHLGSVAVAVGESVAPGQELGRLGYHPSGAHLHFSLGDGDPLYSESGAVQVGQTTDVDDWVEALGVTVSGTRTGDAPDGPADFTVDQLAFIESRFALPVQGDDWLADVSSPAHDGVDYYAIDFATSFGEVTQADVGRAVYAAVAGSDILSTVVWVGEISGAGWGAILRHQQAGCPPPESPQTGPQLVFRDACEYGWLQRYRLSGGQWVHDRDLGEPCTPGPGDPGYDEYPDEFGTPVVLDPVTRVCPVYASCRVVTADTDITAEDAKLNVDASGGAVDLTLPEWTVPDEWFEIVVLDDTNTVTLYPFGSETVNGEASVELTGDYSIWRVTALCDGNWAVG